MSLKARVEAVLFLTDKPLAAAAIAQLVNVDVQEVRQSILELIHDYEERNSALEIADDGGYMMQIKDEFATFANDMAPIDLPVSVVRTLSAIAIKQPVLQSEIVRIRGAGAYDHVKELLEKELITKKEEGRSSLLGTTKKFQEYFRLSQDARALRDQLKEQSKTEVPALQESADSESTIADSASPVAEDPIAESNNIITEDSMAMLSNNIDFAPSSLS
jgi:segregation and condensation protein B